MKLSHSTKVRNTETKFHLLRHLVLILLAIAAPLQAEALKIQVVDLAWQASGYNTDAIAQELNSILSGDEAVSGSSATSSKITGAMIDWNGSSYYSSPSSIMDAYYDPDFRLNTRAILSEEHHYMVILVAWESLVDKPEIVFEGVLKASQMALDAGKQPLLVMPAKAYGTSNWNATLSNTYRIGRGCGIQVVPAGIAVGEKNLANASGTTDSKRQAYLVASMIYSEMTGKNAATSSYQPSIDHVDLANAAASTLNAQKTIVHYTTSSAETGLFRIRHLDPLPSGNTIRIIYNGSSTENGIRRGLSPSLRGNGYNPALSLIDWYQPFDQTMFDLAKPKFDSHPNQYLALYARSTSIQSQSVQNYNQSNILCYGYDRHSDGQLQWDDIHRNLQSKTSGLYYTYDSKKWLGIPIHLAAVRLHEEAPWIPYGRDSTHMHEAMDFAVAAMLTTSMMGRDLDPEKLLGPDEIKSKEWAAGPDEKLGYALGNKLIKQIAFMSETGRFVPDTTLSIDANAPVIERLSSSDHQLIVTGGDAPYTWTIASTQGLPSGLSLTTDGRLTGLTSAAAGLYRTVLRVEDSKGAIKKAPLLLRIEDANSNLRNPDNPAHTIGGINWERFLGNWDQLPNFNTLSSEAEGVSQSITLGLGEPNDFYAYRYTGYIDIPADGVYTFHTLSDDGSKLYIGTTEVTNNDGLHPARERSGTIGLKAGKHSITVTFFEKSGGNLMEAYWSGPGLEKEQIPAHVLHRALTNTYATWATSNFAHTFDNIDPTANDDGDNHDNLLEFAFGTDPTVRDGGSLSLNGLANGTPLVKEGSGSSMEFYFARRDDHGTVGSLRYTVQFSSDLVNYYDSTVTPSFVTNSITNPAYEIVKVPYLDILPNGKAARFGRVKVDFVE